MIRLENLRCILVLLVLVTCTTVSAQDTQWKLEAGKAISQKQFILPTRTSEEIYRMINRWLVKYYESPEENIKARIEGEYLRGVGYRENLVRISAMTSSDLKYSFIFQISDGAVLMTLTDAIVISTAFQDSDAHSRVEDLLKTQAKPKQKHSDSDKVIIALNDFSDSLFKSLEVSVAAPTQ